MENVKEEKIVIIENEFGEVAIDGDLIKKRVWCIWIKKWMYLLYDETRLWGFPTKSNRRI